MEMYVESEAGLTDAVTQLLAFAEGRKKFFLYGNLGAGKTSFIQAICLRLQTHDKVVSPTFSLVNEYLYHDETGQERYVRHLDLYRIEDLEEAIQIGVEDYLFDESYCFVEWPEVIEPLAPEGVVRIQMEVVSDNVRKIVFLKD